MPRSFSFRQIVELANRFLDRHEKEKQAADNQQPAQQDDNPTEDDDLPQSRK